MKLIKKNSGQYLSFKFPAVGAFIMLILLPALQWGVDYEVIPEKYHAFVTG
ncbi:TIGR02594 family protein, partial [Acinetobacter baumannii]|nr:TIGR02594 family protein [Acinetobacter baumannii]